MSWTYESLAVGSKDCLRKTITAGDVDLFADLSLDKNPVHLDEAFAGKTRFGKRIAHGMLSASLISAVVGTKIPGYGAIYMLQSLRFLKPVYLGETLTAWAEVKEKIDEKKRVILVTWVEKENGDRVIEGEATVFFDK